MGLDIGAKVFHTGAMSKRSPSGKSEVSTSLAEVQARLLDSRDDKARLQRLLRQHHYLGGVRPVGEQLFYAVTDGCGEGLGGRVFFAASRRSCGRGRRRPLVVNNCRFLLLPDTTFPNLGSRSLPLVSDRLSAGWQQRYGHPVLVV